MFLLLRDCWMYEEPLPSSREILVKDNDLSPSNDEDPRADMPTSVRHAGVNLSSRVCVEGQRQSRFFLRQVAHVGLRIGPRLCSSHFLWRRRQVRQPVLVRDFLGRSCKCKGRDAAGVDVSCDITARNDLGIGLEVTSR